MTEIGHLKSHLDHRKTVRKTVSLTWVCDFSHPEVAYGNHQGVWDVAARNCQPTCGRETTNFECLEEES